jgi:hypothetical protein
MAMRGSGGGGYHIRHSWGSNQLSAKVVSVVPTIRRGRPRTDGRNTKLLGIGLATSKKR